MCIMVPVCRVSRRSSRERRGAIVVLLALLLIVLFACTAFCVDIGWMTVTKSQLQNAADSAAAGARQLVDNYGAYSLPTQKNPQKLIDSAKRSANSYSTTYGTYNGAGDVKSLKLRPEDIQTGFTDANGNFNAASTGYPNTVRVVARRDSSANRRLPLFFAPAIGRRDAALTATASATIYSGLITSFDPKGGGESFGKEFNGGGDGAWGEDYENSGEGFNNLLLPVAFDVNDWMNFVATGVSPGGVMAADANGSPQIHIYPSPQQAPGNFGLLCIGPWTNSTPSYREWILNGPSASDVQSLLDAGSCPVSQTSPRPWKGSPGLRTTLRSEFAAIIGQPRLLPLFKPASTKPYQAASGAGSNATYNIVGFAGVMVTKVTGAGNNMDISVQPCGVVDPTAVFDPSTMYPVGAEPVSQWKTFTYVAPKLTQ